MNTTPAAHTAAADLAAERRHMEAHVDGVYYYGERLTAQAAHTPRTDDVRVWLDAEFPEGDVAVEHRGDCDRVSAGDACIGGCQVVVA